ncbi:MAG: AAA family ATPase [Fibrobacter sp.]|nr:AAA family ATPase [Fibrobacter sp.]
MKDTPVQLVSVSENDDDSINFFELFVYLKRRWKFLLLFVLMGSIAGLFASRWGRDLYASDILLQVDVGMNRHGRALGEMGALLDGYSPAEAEIELIRSRMVLGSVVKNHKLRFGAIPKNSIDRIKHTEGRIDIDTLYIPRVVYEEKIQVMASIIDSLHYEVYDSEEHVILKGTVGEDAKASYAEDTLFINVRAIYGEPGQKFNLYAMPLQAAISMLLGSINVEEEGKQSGIVRVTMVDEYPDRLVAVLNDIANTYLRQNIEMRSEDARKALVFLKEQLPKLKANLDSSEKNLTDYRYSKKTIDAEGETRVHLQKDVSLEQQLLELEQKKQEALRLFKQEHPAVKTIIQQQNRLKAELNRQGKVAESMPKTQQEELRLRGEVEVNSKLYSSYLNKIQELDVVQAGEVGNVRIVDYAYHPLRPYSPKRKRILLGVVFGFFAFACVILLVRRSLQSGVTSNSEVEKATGIGVYGRIPLLKHNPHVNVKEPYVRKYVNSEISESIRALKTALEFSLNKNNVLLTTGLYEDVGKSFVSLNTAYAMSGAKKVLLIDMDLRKGHLNSGSKGLSEMILEKDLTDKYILRIEENFHVLGAGHKVNNPAKLLESDFVKNLIEQYRSQYDLVVLDSPPIFQCSDALVLEKYADFVLCVLKHNAHNMESIQDFVAALDRGVEHPLSKAFVFNKCESSMGYGYYYHNKYYG